MNINIHLDFGKVSELKKYIKYFVAVIYTDHTVLLDKNEWVSLSNHEKTSEFFQWQHSQLPPGRITLLPDQLTASLSQHLPDLLIPLI